MCLKIVVVMVARWVSMGARSEVVKSLWRMVEEVENMQKAKNEIEKMVV